MNNDIIQDRGIHDQVHAERPTRTLQLIRVTSLLCGIFENEIATIASWREPTPLPQAPQTVLGVVSIQGRMLTVLNLATLLDGDASGDHNYQHILALRGDEQLALAIDSVVETIEISDAVLDPEQANSKGLVLGIINHGGAEITILNVKELFRSAIQGRERRRRRF